MTKVKYYEILLSGYAFALNGFLTFNICSTRSLIQRSNRFSCFKDLIYIPTAVFIFKNKV